MTATLHVDAPTDATGRAGPGCGLRQLVHRVTAATVGEATRFADGTLTVGRDQVAQAFADSALREVRAGVASPGEPVRVVKPLDVVEPRSKGGAGGMFPGFLGPPWPGRPRDTHVDRKSVV